MDQSAFDELIKSDPNDISASKEYRRAELEILWDVRCLLAELVAASGHTGVSRKEKKALKKLGLSQ